MNKIEIPLSRTKLTLTIVGAFSFVFFGIVFIINPDKFITPFLRSPELVRIVGIIASLLFTILGIYGIIKLFDKTVGLTVDENGITDNTNASSVGLIKWSEITEIKAEKVMSTKFLLIFTKNPNKFLEKKSGIKRKILQGNMKMYGTPISITSTTLKYKFDDLNNLLVEKLREQREKKPNV
ncbi:STM3941 family protein [Flavobacterium algicola]|uniref:STM3941 family protein n=1 Tax=Flavobacterium algicola TaxID=556529 RepID=UPI001EFE3B37|nr:STM3941 family protein [Flavobacterium algicola]MCG9792662.1 hypothetical protein [Flavobacterium algicola]